MSFVHTLVSSIRGMFPGLIYWFLLPLTPFIIAEQLRPVGKAPHWRDYGMNILISFSTAFLSMPLGIAAGMLSSRLRHLLPWTPISFSFHRLDAIPIIGHAGAIMAMIVVPLFLHDCWFYWAHRIEHRVPLLWEFHKLHHSDEHMNSSTWARDHFLQESWRSFFSVFTLGLIVDLSLREAGEAALYSTMFLVGLSMFYHSAIRVHLTWLDRIVVTPQVHRIHHSVDSEHHNRNFADALPIFDIVFGTYCRPARDQFPATGLGAEAPDPQSLLAAQFGPLLAVARLLRRSDRLDVNYQRTDSYD
jgi:sterol desaturase/sphingolipid hydroxylase (fatty acid hydroxylase superfamily)